MIDLFESLIKTHTVVIIAEYVKQNKLSDAAKGMLAQGLRTPSLGTWQLFSRILSEELNADGYAWTFPGFAEAFAALDKALNTTKTNVIAIRNGYAHGATPLDAQCESDIHQFEPFMLQLLQSQWLADTSLEYRDEKVWMASASGALCLHPIFLYKEEGGSSPYAFFNDLKNDKVGLLNYPLSKHYREKDFYREFHEYLPLQEWKKTGNNEFQQRIEELTETFKGRIGERKQLLDFVRNNSKGYMSIQGNPGIGKSALIAQFFKDLNAHQATHHLQVVEYFIRRGTAQAQVEYLFNHLIRRTDELFAQGREIRAEGKTVWDLQQQLFSKWRLWNTHCEGRKLLFLIDGLDEGVENNVVTYMPRENFENILIIYGSRPGGHKSIDELWSQLPVAHHTKLELSGLGKADIRALIYEVANKYEIERESAWIDAVQQRSQGNPLYLKLLCDAMENGSIALNDIHALPTKIDDYYKAILNRYAHDADGDALLAGLFAFAAARDYLTMNHLGLINGIGDATVQRIGSTLKEVLYENPMTEDVLDYQLFHESFREYLMKEKGSRVSEAAERIIDFCAGWRALEGTWEQRYALEHYAFHLSESKKEVRAETLLQLIYDHGYTAAQKKVLQGFDASNAMYRLALKKSCELKRDDEVLESALSLVDLKYEEANDATQIVGMVANGEIDLALRRIESFGGGDEEGLKRKFILYMLCLMELTILDSKDKPFRKSSIEKLLNHLDEELPTDHSILNWDDFFPSYLIFQMVCEWAEMGLDYLRVYIRTNEWDTSWIPLQEKYDDLQFSILISSFSHIESNEHKFDFYLKIIDQYIKIKHEKKYLELVYELIDELDKVEDKNLQCGILIRVANKLNDLGDEFDINSILNKALNSAEFIESYYTKAYRLVQIYSLFRKIDLGHKFSYLINEAIDLSKLGSTGYSRNHILMMISTEYHNQDLFEVADNIFNEVLFEARLIKDEFYRTTAFLYICEELNNQKRYDLSDSLIREITSFVNEISEHNDYLKSALHSKISIAVAKSGKFVDAKKLIDQISDESYKVEALSALILESSKSGIFYDLDILLNHFNEENCKVTITSLLISEFAKYDKTKEAIGLFDRVKEKTPKYEILVNLAKTLSIKKNNYLLRQLLFDYLKLEKIILCQSSQFMLLYQIVKEKNLKENIFLTQDLLNEITDIELRNTYLSEFADYLQKTGKINESINLSSYISDSYDKYKSVSNAYKNLIHDLEYPIISEITNSLFSDYYKSAIFCDLALEILKNNSPREVNIFIEYAINFCRNVSEPSLLEGLYSEISKIYFEIGDLKNAAIYLENAFNSSVKIDDESTKLLVLLKLAKQQFSQNNLHDCKLTFKIVSNSFESLGFTRLYFLLADELIELQKKASYGIYKDDDQCKFDLLHKRTIESLFDFDKLNDMRDIIFDDFATRLANNEIPSKAIEFVSKIIDINRRSNAIKNICFILCKKENLNFSFINDIINLNFLENDKNSVYSSIYISFIKNNILDKAEEIFRKINLLKYRQTTLFELAKEIIKLQGNEIGLNFHLNFKAEDLKYFYLRGWSESINITDISNNLSRQALAELVFDSTGLEHFLLVYAHHELFFSNPSQEKINRLNKTLNIQWAIDIRSKFLKEESSRNSGNVEDWIHAIEDEDDRDQVLLWAKQVAKGKITDAEFGEKIKAFI
jgi:hypothetical protein